MLLGRGEEEPFQQLGGGDLLSADFDAAGGFFNEFDHLALQSLPLGESLGVLVEIADVDGLPQP